MNIVHPTAKTLITLVVVITLALSFPAQVPRWSEELLDPGVKSKYRRMTRAELKKALTAAVKQNILLFRIVSCACIIILSLSVWYLFRLNSSTSTIFSVSWTELTLLAMAGGIKEKNLDPRLDIIIEDGVVTIVISGPITIKSPVKSALAKLLVITLYELVLPPAPGTRRRLSQEVIAACTGYSKSQVNTLIQRYRKHGLEGLLRMPRGGLLSKEAVDRVVAYLKEDLSLTPSAISRRLKKEEFTEATSQAVRNTLARLDFNQLKEAIRSQLSADGVSGDVFERLLALTDRLIGGSSVPACELVELEELKTHQIKPNRNPKQRNWDQEEKRLRDAERKAQKEHRLQARLNHEAPRIICPDCGENQVQLKERRERNYQGIYGKEAVINIRYFCPQCERSFTISPQEIEPYLRSERNLIRYALSQIFKNVSLSEVELDDLIGRAKVDKTTILRWMKRSADLMPDWQASFGSRSTGTVSIDEKWVNLRGKWSYVFMATDTQTLDIMHIEVYRERTTESAKTFLCALKTMGFNPKTIITDGCPIYDNAIFEVYPQTEHIRCILHLSRSMRNRLMKVFGSYADTTYKELAPLLSAVYAARNEKDFNAAWNEWSRMQKQHVELQEFATKLTQKKEEIKARVLKKDVPRTTNSVERVIKEFERKYGQLENFMSLPYAQAWCKHFQIYFRLRPFKSGRNAGRSPAQVLGYPVENLSWTDYILPGGEYTRDDQAA